MKPDRNGNRGGPPHRSKPPMKQPPQGAARSSRAPEQTFEEVRYLKHLIEERIPVRIKLEDNSLVSGTIEYYDHSFIRLTREPAEPNLFIYKHEIKYLYEVE